MKVLAVIPNGHCYYIPNVIPKRFLTLGYMAQLFSGVESVGTVPASLVTYASILAIQPDLIINAGTAGGFKVFTLQIPFST